MTTVDIETLLGQDDLRSLIEACEHTGAIRAPEVHEIVETHELDGLEQEALVRELEKRGIEIVEAPAMEVPAPAEVRQPPAPARRPRPRRTRSSCSSARRAATGCSPRRRR